MFILVPTTETKSPVEASEATDRLPSIAESTPNQNSGLTWEVIAVLALLILVGLAFRGSHLGAIGFAEDEVNKVDAVEAYDRKFMKFQLTAWLRLKCL